MDQADHEDRHRTGAANRALRAHRFRLGLTQQEVAEALLALAWEHDHQRLGVDAGMVSKWERGQKCPRKLYRRLLCRLYDATEQQLGFRSAHAPDDQAAEDDVNRRQFLQDAAHLGIGVGLTAFERGHQRRHSAAGRGVDPDTVDGYVTITAAQRTLYWTTPPPVMFESSTVHMRMGVQLLRDARGSRRERLAAAVSESALLSSRVAFFDLGRAELGPSFLHVARELACQAEDQALAAAVHGHMAFVPGFAGDLPTAQASLDAARGHACHAPSPRLASWLHCVHGEIAARNGKPREACRQIRSAEDALESGDPDPPWLDFFDPARLRAFKGYVQLLSGDDAQAVATLEEALEALAPTATKQRSIVRLDLAAAFASSDPDHSLHLVGEAVDALESDWYAMAHDRIPRVRRALKDTPCRAELEDRLRSLPALAV